MSASVVIDGDVSLINTVDGDASLRTVINGQGMSAFFKNVIMIVNLIVVDPNVDHVRLDRTWKEIHDALNKGIIPVVIYKENDNDLTPFILRTYYYEPDYCVSASYGNWYNLTTTSQNGYPSNFGYVAE